MYLSYSPGWHACPLQVLLSEVMSVPSSRNIRKLAPGQAHTHLRRRAYGLGYIFHYQNGGLYTGAMCHLANTNRPSNFIGINTS